MKIDIQTGFIVQGQGNTLSDWILVWSRGFERFLHTVGIQQPF